VTENSLSPIFRLARLRLRSLYTSNMAVGNDVVVTRVSMLLQRTINGDHYTSVKRLEAYVPEYL